jgi:hypothetical protein
MRTRWALMDEGMMLDRQYGIASANDKLNFIYAKLAEFLPNDILLERKEGAVQVKFLQSPYLAQDLFKHFNIKIENRAAMLDGEVFKSFVEIADFVQALYLTCIYHRLQKSNYYMFNANFAYADLSLLNQIVVPRQAHTLKP